jgi:hypothetical protein
VSTRRLILAALMCGLAIVLAGGFKLLQVAGDGAEVQVLPMGRVAELGDMRASVDAIEEVSGATLVTVTMTGVEGADALEGWRMLTGGEVFAPEADADPAGGDRCTVTRATEPVTCTVVFPESLGTVTVAYLRAGAQAQWAR